MKQNFIIVSNRLPVSVSKKDGELVFTPSYGGLATAMASLNGNTGKKIWIGWPGINSDDLTPTDKSKIIKKLNDYGCYPVFLSRAQIDKFYSGYANDTIWPLFHYFQSYAKYDNTYWDGYKEVNKIYKNAITKMADPKASIWVHDYHLMLLPEMLRDSLPGSTIGFFLHIPFPSFEIFRFLPNRKEVLNGLLGADLIGFHTYDYARHFLSSILRILGIDNNHGSIIIDERVIRVDAFPISLDYEWYARLMENPDIKSEVEKLRDHYKDTKVIVSAGDRLDYSKGILKRLEAFEKFLIKYPNYHKKVVLVIQTAPSRTDVETYKELRDQIEKAVARINGQYSTMDWIPITYQFKTLRVDQIMPMFIVADVALVTPLRDGMNLTAKEYVAVKQNLPGVLILSEMAGAVDELPEAIRINPNDTDAIATAINDALKMPKKLQRDKIESMQDRLSIYTVKRWADDFLDQLNRTKHSHKQQNSKLLSAETEAKIVRIFKKSKKRLLMLDYDGTLRSFAPSYNPQLAVPPQSLMDIIEALAKQKNTKLCIVSGRQREVMQDWFDDLPVMLAAEHGAWIKHEGEWSQQQVSLHNHRHKILPILEHYAERTPGARVEQKDFAIVWHYRNVPVELAHARNANLRSELTRLLANTDVGVYSGAKIIEIKPRGLHKGVVAEDMMALYPSDFILCIGDDYTDEDMFRSLPDEAISIKVGLGDTNARYQVVSVNKVLQLLRKLLD